MSFQHSELELTYHPDKQWAHFVLYTEPERGIVGSGLNAAVSLERQTPYVREWQARLQRAEPNSLHATLVENRKIPELFYACVEEDRDSPSAVAGSGCLCSQTWYDPEFGLPVVANHYRTVGGNTDTWTYQTYTPLELRPDDTFESLIIDAGEAFWIRTADGVLALLPEVEGHGYGVGSRGGGSRELAEYIQQLIDSDGRDTAARTGRRAAPANPKILDWVASKDATHCQELTLQDLKNIGTAGTPTKPIPGR